MASLYHVHFDCLPGNPLQVPEAVLDANGGRSDGLNRTANI
jgi:hypothetical protein